jgi:FMN phosphatase YigB (HAD superfamily)
MAKKLVTFDVWGTLLTRRCSVEDVKLFTCTALGLLHGEKLQRKWMDPGRLRVERGAIERSLSARAGEENVLERCQLREIFRRLCQTSFAVGLASKEVVARIADELAEIELEQERFVSGPAVGIHNLLRQYEGKRIAFLADSSLTAREIGDLLRSHGLHQCADLGVTTADLAGSEAATLFELAESKFGIAPADWVHHGDAATAQRWGAGKLGIAVRSQSSAIAKSSTPGRTVDVAIGRQLPEVFGAFGASAGQGATRQAQVAAEMMQIGVNAAPLFAGFAMWILEQALKNKSEHIYFFAREGQFFAQVYEVIADAYFRGITSPGYSILSVSRLATFSPSLTDLSPASFEDVWALYKPQSVAGLIATLGIEDIDVEAELARFDLTAGERIDAPDDDPRLAALLAYGPFRVRVMQALGEMRERLLSYLASRGLDGRQRNVSVVDIGWHGSIQGNIARLLPSTSFQGLYLGLNKRRSKPGPNATKQAYVVDLERSVSHADLVTYVAPMEFLCGASFGSTVGYTQAQPPEPIRMAQDEATRRAFNDVVLPFQSGVLAGVAQLSRDMRAHSLSSQDMAEEAVEVWHRLVQRPTQGMANAFAETTVDETFGFGRMFRLPRDGGFVRENQGFSEGASSFTNMLQDTVRSIPWPQAFAHYAEDAGMMRYVMPAAVRAARRGRRLQNQLRGIVVKRQTEN